MFRKFKFILAFMLALTTIPLATQTVQAETESVVEADYELYPIPQSIEYLEGEFILNTEVNIVLETDIDEYTQARLQEILDLKGITGTFSDALKEGTTNILVGVKGSGEYVDAYFTENLTLKNTALFDKIDAHYLHVEDDVITVLGKDTDSAFYGLTTLYHVVKQMDSFTIRNFVTEDYADVISRGFIEGYYGEPWSTQDRVDLMEFGGYYKSNSYFYAPKDDPKHNAQWRAPYTEAEMVNMEKMAVAGNESKTRFVYAIHPFMNNVFRFNSDANYNEDFEVLTTKLKQMLDVGVRQFSILGDDASVPGGDANNYVRLLTDLTDWIVEQQADYPGLKKIIPFVPHDYMGWGNSAEIQTLKKLPENIQIVMTGGKVWGEVSQNFTSTFTDHAGRGPYMWINWPVTDNSKQHLIMGGGHKFLQPGVDPANIEGIVLNPMQQSEASKLSVFYGAAYSWNIWEDEAEALEAWENAFSYVDHNSAIETESSIAFKELSKHMINQDMDSRVVALEESIDLSPKLNDFKEKLANNTVTEADVDAIIAEFEILDDAAKTYRANPGTVKTRDQIVYWLNSWDDTNEAALSYLKAVKAVLNGDQSALVNLYAQGQEAFARSKTHGFSYIDHIEYAEVGVQHIVPFIQNLGSVLTESVNEAAGLASDVKVITNIASNPDGGLDALDNIVDGQLSTFTYWKNYFPRKGDYVGIDFRNDPKMLENFEISLGRTPTDHDTFNNGRVEYTVDGDTWIIIDDLTFTNQATNSLKYTFDVPTEVKALRVVTTEDLNGKWFAIREISYNDGLEEAPERDFEYNIIKSSSYTVYQGSEANLYDGDDTTMVWYNPKSTEPNKDTALKDSFIGYNLGRAVELDSLHLVVGHSGGDKFQRYAIETSLDNAVWAPINDTYANFTGNASGKDVIDVKLNGLKAQYVRVRNLVDQPTWVKFSEFTVKEVQKDSTEHVYTNLETSPLYSELRLGKASLTSGDVTLDSNQYIGLIFDHIKEITASDIQFTGEGLVLEASKNAYEWKAFGANEKFDARYIRLVNKTDNAVNATVEKFDLSLNEILRPDFLETDIVRNTAYGDNDVRIQKNGRNAFDGNMQTSMSISGYPQTGNTIVFDLGQERDIHSMAYYVVETQMNFIRNAVFELGNDPQGDDWTELFTVGDGIENNVHNSLTAKDVDYLTHSSTYPGYMQKGASDLDAQGRFLRVRFTTTYNYRFVSFNQIMINDGEYVAQELYKDVESASVEEPYQLASSMFDKNLDTSYQLQDENSSFTYHLSEPLSARRIKIVQKGASSNALVKAELYTVGDASMATETVTLGNLSQTISEFDIPKDKILKELTVSWSDTRPVISEIIQVDRNSVIDRSVLEDLINQEVDTSTWTSDSKASYTKALATASEVMASDYASQSMINSAAASLQTAINNAVDVMDPSALEALLDEEISNADKIYTEVSFTNYQNKLRPVRIALEDKANLDVARGQKLLEDVNTTITELKYSRYQSELAQLKLRDLKSFDLEEADYTNKSYQAFVSAKAALEALVNKEKAGDTVTPFDFKAQRETLEALDLVSILQLKSSLETFETINQDMYTTDSYANYKALAAEAIKLLVDGSKTAIAQAVEDLDAAHKALVIAEKDLGKLLEEINNLDKDLYASLGYNALMDYANGLDTDVSEEEQAVIYAKLKGLMDNLVNVSALKTQLEKVGKIEPSDYTVDSYAVLENAITSATELLTSAKNSEEVGAALDTLETAQQALESRVSQTDYKAFMDDLKDYSAEDYTASSYLAYQKSLDVLKGLNLENTSRERFMELKTAYESAVSKLEKRVSQAEFDEFMVSVEELKEAHYTSESFMAYQEALDAIKALDLDETTETEFKALVSQYNQALKELVKIDIDEPTDPTDPEDSEKPGDKDEGGTVIPSKPSTPDASKDGDLPATGMESNVALYIFAASMILIGGLFLVLKKSKENHA